jgi:hypothetical protein
LKDRIATEKALSATETRDDTASNLLTQLAPNWLRKFRLGQVRMKTFLKIYISKWFWKGLEWYEIEFLLVLLSRVNDGKLEWFHNLEPHNWRRIGSILYLEMRFEDEEQPLNLVGWNLLEPVTALDEYLLSYQDYNAVWKLRTVQSLRDLIFVPVTGHEHEGKKGIKKRRIRGYRDGKSSPRDPHLTAMARQVDRIFYENLFEERWNELETEIKRLTQT